MVPFVLHMHSFYSDDGEYSPKELVNLCKKAGIRVMAVADHNCTKACGPALAAAEEAGIRAVPAVEIDCTFRGTDLHVLGYGIRYESQDFAKIEERIAEQNEKASHERLNKTRALGFFLTEEELDEETVGNYWKHVWAGETFGKLLLAKEEYRDSPLLLPYRPGGKRSDNPYVNFYWDYYSQGKPCHAAMEYPSFEETLSVIHRNGGKAVLAHPGNNLKGREELLEPMREMGLDGIEVFCSYHGEKEREFYAAYARAHGMILTCGSDFHGKIKPAVAIGGHGCMLSEEEMEREIQRLLEKA